MKNENNITTNETENEIAKTLETVAAMKETMVIRLSNAEVEPSEYASMLQTLQELEDVLREFQVESNKQSRMAQDTSASTSADTAPISTEVPISTPFGPITVDLKAYDSAKVALESSKKKKTYRSVLDQILYDFLGDELVREGKYWNGNLGVLMKIHFESFVEAEWDCIDEFAIRDGARVACTYSTYDFPNGGKERFLAVGHRLYQSKSNPESNKFVIEYTIDHDGDHRLVLCRAKKDVPAKGEEKDAHSTIISKMDEDFYVNGPLNGQFFDLRYNYIDRDLAIEELIAWDENIKQLLWNDIINFQKAMPVLLERGIPNSRGIILAGPPGTGKTMIAKWLAANSTITCILISAEMISGRHDIKRCYEVARKLSPSMLIIEDIDTAGALDRRASDHPLLGEFLQAMDGVVSNNGVITLATTNHSDKIDPAIADRPGRFDRIIEVGMPCKDQRFHILRQLLEKMDLAPSVDTNAINQLAKMSDGLTGAWLREVVQSAFISTFSSGEKTISKKHLTTSLKDVMQRRGMAYRVAGYETSAPDSSNAYVQ